MKITFNDIPPPNPIVECMKCGNKRHYDGVDMNCHHDGYWYLDSPYFYRKEKGWN